MKLPLLLAAALVLSGCITSEVSEPAAATVPPVIVSDATELWRIHEAGVHRGWLVRYTPWGEPQDAFLSVRNPWQQELGMIDGESRWWRFQAHDREPVLIGAGATADGVTAILELVEAPQLIPSPLSDLGD